MQVRHNIPQQALGSLAGFVNRDRELLQAKDYLRQYTRTWLVTIYGIGGSGKTTFALKVAQKAIEEGSFDVVVWSTAKSERFDPRKARIVSTASGFPAFRRKRLESLNQLLGDILKLFEVSNRRDWSVDDRLDQVRSLLRSRRTLIVVDDFELLGSGAAEDISEFVGRTLPEPTKAMVTSRQVLGIPGEAAMRLAGLPSVTWRQLLMTRAKQLNVAAASSLVERDLHRLYQLTGGNPLALELVVGQLNRVPLGRILDSAERVTRTGGGSEAYTEFEDFLFERAFSFSDADSQRLWLTLAAIGEPQSEVELAQLTHLSMDGVRESVEWLDSNGLITRSEGLVRLHPIAVSFGRRVLLAKESLPREIEAQIENLYSESQSERHQTGEA
jgi:hypothetical protein